MKKEIEIADVIEKKKGSTKGRKWTLWEVVDGNGDKYTTFDGKYLELIGTIVEIEYKEEQNGKYVNRTILEPKKQFLSENVAAKPQYNLVVGNSDVVAELKVISQGLREIYKLIKENADKFTNPL